MNIQSAINNIKIPNRKNEFTKIFKLENLLVPEQFEILNYPRKPIAVFNPGAFLTYDNKLILFPRLVFDDRFYISSIGMSDLLDLNYLNNNSKINIDLLKYPTESKDFLGLEDSRVTQDGKQIVWVALNKEHMGCSVSGDLNIKSKKITNIRYFKLEDSIILSGRDAAFINENYLVFRPEYNVKYSFSSLFEKTDNVLLIKDKLKTVLVAQEWEEKIGFSTNFLKIKSNEFLVGYHALRKSSWGYESGFIMLDKEGNLLGHTNYLLHAEKELSYGNRINTLFGCGLIKLNNKIWWIGGVGDWAIALYSCNLKEILEHINYI